MFSPHIYRFNWQHLFLISSIYFMCFLTQSYDACSYDKIDASNLFTPELRKQARLIPPAELRTVYQNTPTLHPPCLEHKL